MVLASDCNLLEKCAARGCTVFAACRTTEAIMGMESLQMSEIRSFVMDVASEQSVQGGFSFVTKHL